MNNDLLIAYYKGEVPEAEARRITEWLMADKEHEQYYLRLCRLFEISYWMDGERKPEREAPAKKRFRLTGTWQHYARVVSQLAAVFVLGMAVHFFLNHSMNTAPEAVHEIEVPTGQHVQLLLADGSKVWLNSKSSLSFPAAFNGKERRVKLKGEGFFEVKADAERPFIVSTDHYEVKALGTAFNVCGYEDTLHFETALLHGKVEVKNLTEQGQTVTLMPHERAIADNHGWKVKPIESVNHYLWREGILYFNEPLTEVFEKLSDFYDIPFEVKDKELKQKAPFCTGKFRTKDGLEHILRVLKETHHFDYYMDTENKKILIS